MSTEGSGDGGDGAQLGPAAPAARTTRNQGSTPGPVAAQLEAAAVRGDRTACLGILETLYRSHGNLHTLVEVVAESLASVGVRWEQEGAPLAPGHTAAATLTAALASLAETVAQPRLRRGRVVLLAAPHDWHLLQGTLFGLLLRERGWEVVRFGPSAPDEWIADTLRTTQPSGVCISCPMPVSLPGVARRIAMVQREWSGPIFVGGGGMLDRPGRAATLGALFASGASHVDRGLGDPAALDNPPPVPASTLSTLEGLRHDMRGHIDEFRGTVPGLHVGHHLLNALTAASLVSDAELFEGELRWLTRVLGSRTHGTQSIRHTLHRLAARVGSPPFAGALIERTLDQNLFE